jgi:hypothetical protein
MRRSKILEPYGYRLKRRFTRRQAIRRRRILIFSLLVVIGVAGISFHFYSQEIISFSKRIPLFFQSRSEGQKQSFKKSNLTQKKQEAEVKPLTVVLIGRKEGEGKVEADKILVLRLDFEARKLEGLDIPPKTFVSIPGHGFSQVQHSLQYGEKILLATLTGILGVKLDSYLTLDHNELDRLSNEKSFALVFRKSRRSNLSYQRRQEIARKVATWPVKNKNVVRLPVKLVSISEDIFFEVDRAKTKLLVKNIWHVEIKEEEPLPRVIVLNGCGRPGIGAAVAKLLAKNGFIIIETKNADNFNYEQTKIIIYKGDLVSAEKIRRLLGVGKFINRHISQNIIDLTVVIGKDYKPLN